MTEERRRVLVTGGAGFIGSHVVDALLQRGHEVAVLDNLSTGNRDHVSPRATLYEASVTDPQALERVFQVVSPHWVSHHAAQISVTSSMEDPVGDAQTNVVGSLRLLEACRRHGVEYLAFASTGGGLYGEPEQLPAPESHSVRPLAPYGAAKYAVEAYLGVYRATWGLRSAALRYANVYGPRQSHLGEAGVVAIFAGQMLSGQTPTIYGTGEQERDFVCVSDVVEANMLAMEQRLEGSFNVGTGTLTSVDRIAEALRDLCGYTGPVAHAAARPGEVRRISLDSRLFQEATGWSCRVPLEEGLRQTVDSFRPGRALPGA